MSLEAWNQVFLWASVGIALISALWASTALSVLAALSTGAAILSARKIDQKNRTLISELQPRHIYTKQKNCFT